MTQSQVSGLGGARSASVRAKESSNRRRRRACANLPQKPSRDEIQSESDLAPKGKGTLDSPRQSMVAQRPTSPARLWIRDQVQKYDKKTYRKIQFKDPGSERTQTFDVISLKWSLPVEFSDGVALIPLNRSDSGQAVPADSVVYAENLITCSLVAYIYHSKEGNILGTVAFHAHTGAIKPEDGPMARKFNSYDCTPEDIEIIFASSQSVLTQDPSHDISTAASGLWTILDQGISADKITILSETGPWFGISDKGQVGSTRSFRATNSESKVPKRESGASYAKRILSFF